MKWETLVVWQLVKSSFASCQSTANQCHVTNSQTAPSHSYDTDIKSKNLIQQKKCKAIYNKELQPSFGNEIPLQFVTSNVTHYSAFLFQADNHVLSSFLSTFHFKNAILSDQIWKGVVNHLPSRYSYSPYFLQRTSDTPKNLSQ